MFLLDVFATGAATAGIAASGGASLIGTLPLLLFFGLAIYFIPAFIAYKRQCLQKVSILLLNIFLGWTFIGWVIALIWANMKDKNNA